MRELRGKLSSVWRETGLQSALMTPPELPKKTEENPATRVAIVCEPKAVFWRTRWWHYLPTQTNSPSPDSSITPNPALSRRSGFIDPDIVVATLGAFEATNTRLFLASPERAFPACSVLVTTTSPDTFDFFGVLEMGASDFLLPPLRRSESHTASDAPHTS